MRTESLLCAVADLEERVAVRLGACDELGGDIAAGAGTVFDHELLAEFLRQPGRNQPHRGIGKARRWKADDDAYRARRIVDGPGPTGGLREGSGGRGKLQQCRRASSIADLPNRSKDVENAVYVAFCSWTAFFEPGTERATALGRAVTSRQMEHEQLISRFRIAGRERAANKVSAIANHIAAETVPSMWHR